MKLNLDSLIVTTTAGETFTGEESQQLARLVYKRFGRDLPGATRAWNRLLGNSCTTEYFAQLIGEE